MMDYCILSMGSKSIKSKMQDNENVRSLLFYGPEGSGKSFMAQAIASEIGALFINLSSTTIGSAFGGKEGATKLIHMVFTVAKEKSYAPVVIYLDNCHDFFMGKSKRGGGSDGNPEMQRFQKDLLIYKNQALTKEDRVLVIGCTNMPEKGDAKVFKWKGPIGKPEKQGFFERFLFFPRANHAGRTMIWKELIQKRVLGFKKQSRIDEIDYDALAFLSSGLSAGEISFIVESVLSVERSNTLGTKPLSERDFFCLFANSREQDDERFLNFTRQITDLDSRWKSINEQKKGSDPKRQKSKQR